MTSRVLLPSPTEGVEMVRWKGRPTLSRKSGFTSLVALGCLGHREKLGWGGRPKALSCFPPHMVLGWGLPWRGCPQRPTELSLDPADTGSLFSVWVLRLSPFNNVKSLRLGSLSFPPTPNCQFSVYQASGTF